MAIDYKPYERYVQQGMVDGQFASGAFTMIAAGPPRLANVLASGAVEGQVASALAQPIGLIQNMSLSHNKGFSRIFELGSERSYHIAGRTQGNISLSRIYYHGPSLLRMLYAYYSDSETPVIVPPFTALSALGQAANPNPHNVKIRPGFNNLYLNLMSDLFSQPIGLLIKTVDSNEDTIGAVYAEACYVPNHSFSVDANGLVVQESVGIQFERIVPVRVTSLDLIQTATEGILGLGASLLKTSGDA
jgi:hypothetical protein